MLRYLLLAIVLVAAVSCADVRQQFIEFQHTYGKFYSTPEEYNYRLGVFQQNIENAARIQAKSPNGVFGVTKFMDMTTEEFKSTVLMAKVPPRQNPRNGPYHHENFANFTAPNSFTWWGKGVTTPVYNQGQCGSCWAFSATENVESQWALAGHPLTSLSMQQVVSCDTTCYGCGGGWPYLAYAYIASAGGIDTYASYPYTSGGGNTGSCAFNPATVDAKLNPSNSWTYVTQSQNEGEMVNYLVAHGPLSICVDAEPWQYYTSGVLMASQCSTSIDHCVDAVGYNLGASTPYWIVRNSWGTDWGQSGFIWLQYGQDTCAMAQVVTNALVA